MLEPNLQIFKKKKENIDIAFIQNGQTKEAREKLWFYSF